MPVPLDLTRLLAPASVIVVGATDRAGSYAAQTLLNLRRAGYPGPVVGVHPRRADVLGVPCRPTLEDAVEQLGAPADAVVIATPAESVTGYLESAGQLRCGGAVVYAAGFGESGATAAQADLVETARRHHLPLLGPNANGLVAVGARAPLWGDAVQLPDRAGPIALVTQSGNIGVLALAHRAGLGLHSVVSLGNAAVVDAADVLTALSSQPSLTRPSLSQPSGLSRSSPSSKSSSVEDPPVRAVALYLEDDGDGARLADALAACARADVRVAVLKTGRSTAGREAAGAHTAALAGDHRVFAALVEEAGGVLVREPLELLETARALAGGRRTPGRLAVLTASGGDAAITADLAADAGVPLAQLTTGTRQQLAALLPHTATVTNPLDHTNLVWADTEAIAGLTAALAVDPDVGPVIYVQDEPPGLPEVDAAEWAATRAGAELGGRRAQIVTTLVATTPGQEPPDAIAGLWPALIATAALRRPAPDPKRLDAIARAGRRPGRSALVRSGWLAEHEAKAVLARVGVPVPAGAVVAGDAPEAAETAVAAAGRVGFPVVLKLSAPGLLHKSEAGALALDLPDEAAVRAAASQLLRLERAPGAVLLVEELAAPGVELVIAARRDGVVPALVIGLGGIWAETLDDVVVLPLPVDPHQVVDGLRRLRAAPLLTGGRGRAPVDLRAIGEIACRIGRLLLSEGFALVEVNPLIAGPDGASAVDAMIRC
jgi:acetate---CoA ligase (ADP-forming)